MIPHRREWGEESVPVTTEGPADVWQSLQQTMAELLLQQNNSANNIGAAIKGEIPFFCNNDLPASTTICFFLKIFFYCNGGH